MTDKKYEEHYRRTLANSPGTRLRKNIGRERHEMLVKHLKEKIERLTKKIRRLEKTDLLKKADETHQLFYF